jgi:signal peptidase II
VLALAADRVTKILALLKLNDGSVHRYGFLKLWLVHNPGATLGLGSNYTWVIAVFAVIVCIVIIYLQLFKSRNLWWSAVLALIFAGALGNFIDRIIYAKRFMDGAVVDFIDYGWSVGNVADVFLTLAVIGLVILFICGVPFGRPYHSEKNDDLNDDSVELDDILNDEGIDEPEISHHDESRQEV